MYTIYIDDKVLYSPLLSNKGYSVLNAKVLNELNKAGSLEFKIPPNNNLYNQIKKLSSNIKVTELGKAIYEIKDDESFEKWGISSLPNRVIYKDAVVDGEKRRIVLSNPLNTNGSDYNEQRNNYKEYPYFYSDYMVYKYTKFSSYTYIYCKEIYTKFIPETEVFSGRVLHSEKDFYNRKYVYCEGELSYLLDSIQRPYSFQGNIPELVFLFIDNHNNQVDSNKHFTVGNITVTDPNDYINRESSQYPNTLDELNKKLIDTHGGYLKIRKENDVRYLDYLAESGKTSSQTIEFGTNLIDITEYITAENVFTVLIPLGAKQEDETKLTIESVNNGKDYIEDETGISLFGRIEKVQEWEDVTIADNLLKKGKEFLKSGIEMAVSLQLKAIDMHLLNVDAESISIGDNVRVISPPHNIDTLFQCSKIELDLLEPDKSVYTFGVNFTSLTEIVYKKG